MTDTTKLDLLQRLFAAYGKEPSEEQVLEWKRVADKYRTDFVAQAVESLIETSNRFPTIADFKMACMGAWSRHDAIGGTLGDESGLMRSIRMRAEQEKNEWYEALFGSYANAVRSLVTKTCGDSSRPYIASQSFGAEMSPWNREKLKAEELGIELDIDFKSRYESMRQLANSIHNGIGIKQNDFVKAVDF